MVLSIQASIVKPKQVPSGENGCGTGAEKPLLLEFYTGKKPALERTVNIDMTSSMVIYHRSIPADIAFVAQIDNSWNMKRNIEEVLEVARGYNRDRHMFSLPSKYDIFFSNGHEIMRIDGVCNEFVSGWDLLNTYKFVVPIGNNDFVSGWNATFGIGFNVPFVRIPQEAIDDGIFGCKTLLLTGRELCRRGSLLRGEFVSLRRISSNPNECESQCIRNKRKSFRNYLLSTYGEDAYDSLFFVSRFTDWNSKWLINAFNGEVCSMIPASSDYSYAPDMKKVKEIIALISGSNAKALPFTFTVGVEHNEKTGESKTFLMEVAPISVGHLPSNYSSSLADIAVASYVLSVQNSSTVA